MRFLSLFLFSAVLSCDGVRVDRRASRHGIALEMHSHSVVTTSVHNIWLPNPLIRDGISKEITGGNDIDDKKTIQHVKSIWDNKYATIDQEAFINKNVLPIKYDIGPVKKSLSQLEAVRTVGIAIAAPSKFYVSCGWINGILQCLMQGKNLNEELVKKQIKEMTDKNVHLKEVVWRFEAKASGPIDYALVHVSDSSSGVGVGQVGVDVWVKHPPDTPPRVAGSSIGACLRTTAGEAGYGTHIISNFHGRAHGYPNLDSRPIRVWKRGGHPDNNKVAGIITTSVHDAGGDYDIVELQDPNVCACRGIVDASRVWNDFDHFFSHLVHLQAHGHFGGLYYRGLTSGLSVVPATDDPRLHFAAHFNLFPDSKDYITTEHASLPCVPGDSGAGLIYRVKLSDGTARDVLIGIMMGKDRTTGQCLYTPIWNINKPPNTYAC